MSAAGARIPMRAMDEHLTAALGALSLFAGLPLDEIEQIEAMCDICTAHPGQMIQAQGVPARRWHLLLAGHAIAQRDSRPIALVGKGDSWSEHSMLNHQPSPIAVVALSPVTLLTLHEREFFAIPEQHPVLAGRLVARSASSVDRLAQPLFDALEHQGRGVSSGWRSGGGR